MRPQFPGMDPWLEQPELWPDVHNSLIAAIRDQLAPMVRPRYFVSLESRTTVLSGPDVDRVYEADVSVLASTPTPPLRQPVGGGPGVAVLERVQTQPIEVVVPVEEEEIEETFLSIKELPGRKLVTAIEVLSPTNKKAKGPRADYLQKRRDLIRARINFIEVDLLRGGQPMPLIGSPPSDYRILIHRAKPQRKAVVYAFPWTGPIPTIPVPLQPDDTEPQIDLNSLLHSLMDRAGYDLMIDYRQPPRPRLRPEERAWAAPFLARAMQESAPTLAEEEAAP